MKSGGQTRGRARSWVIVALVSAVVSKWLSSPVWAQPPPSDGGHERARTLFQEGKDALEAGDVSVACAKLEESRRLLDQTDTVFRLAQCYERSGRLASAQILYRLAAKRVAEEDETPRKDQRIATTGSHLRAIEGKVPLLVIRNEANSSIENVEVRVRNVVVERDAQRDGVPLDPGTYAVTVTGAGKRAWNGEVTVKAEAARTELIVPPLVDLPPRPAGAPKLPVVTPPHVPLYKSPASSDPFTPRDVGVVVGLSFATAGAAAGTALAVAWWNQRGVFERECPVACASYTSHKNALDALAVGGTAAFATGGVGLGIASILWITAPVQPPKGSPGIVSSISISANGASWVGIFHF